MQTISISHAKTHLSRLVERVASGESFVITRFGKPMAQVIAVSASEAGQSSRLGFLAGQLTIPEDFDGMCRGEIQQLFEGGD